MGESYKLFGFLSPLIIVSAQILSAGQLHDYNSYNIPIFDNCTIASSDLNLIGAPGNAKITNVKCYFEIYHDRHADLKIWLTTWYDGEWHDLILYNQGQLSSSGRLKKSYYTLPKWNGAEANQEWFLSVKDCVTGNNGYIDHFELWVDYDSNGPPETPNYPNPTDGASGVSIDTNLDWGSSSDPDGDNVYYTVYFEKNDSNPDVVVKNDQSGAYANLGILDYNSHY